MNLNITQTQVSKLSAFEFQGLNCYIFSQKPPVIFLYKEAGKSSLIPHELSEGTLPEQGVCPRLCLCARVCVCLPGKRQRAQRCRWVPRRLLFGCGESTHAGEVKAVTWPPVAVSEFSPLWRKGQPCGWTVSPTLMLVLCLEGGVLFFIFIF